MILNIKQAHELCEQLIQIDEDVGNKYKQKLNKFIPKEEALKSETKYEYEVVHCTTQEEWNFVLNKLNYTRNTSKEWSIYKENSCLNIDKDLRSDFDFYLKNNAKIYSFQEWCDKFGHKPDFKPKFEVGKWYKVKFLNQDYIIQVSKLKDDFLNFSMSISKENIIHSYIPNNWGSPLYDFTYISEITDLSEIQQYLPDNHPDKIKVMKEESLVGRYLKALVDYPNSGAVKAGEYGLITYHKNGCLQADFPSQKNYACSLALEKGQTKYQIMPEGFTPDNIPEYVECYHLDKNGSEINFTVGKIYELKNGSPIDDSGTHRNCINAKMWNHWFKPSTKEAFEAQGKSTDTNWIPQPNEWVIFLGGYSDLKLNKAYQIQEHQFEDYYYLKGTGFAPKKDKHFRKALPHEIPGAIKSGEPGIYWSKEYPLTPNELYKVGIDPYSEKALELYKPKDELIDTSVNNTQSVKVELYQPEELQLF